MEENEPDEGGSEEHLEDSQRGDHAYRLAEMAQEDARRRIQRLLVTGDNRLKQGVAREKVRECYEQALALAREAGLEEAVRPLVEIRLADLDRLPDPGA